MLGVLFCLEASAEKVQPWKGGKGRGVRTEHLAMPLLDDGYYSDRYTIEAWLEDGSKVYVSVLVSNFGLSKGTMKVRSRWKDGGEGGKYHSFDKEVAKGSYKASAEPFSVGAADHVLSGTPRRFKVKGQAGPRAFELTFASGLPPFRPGTGRTTFGDIGDKFHDQSRVQTKAEVTGWVTRGGKQKVKGYGYVSHSISNIAPHNMMKWYMQVRSIASDTVLYIDLYKTTAQYGGKRIGYVYLARGGKVEVVSIRPQIKFGKVQRDSKHPNNYRIPFELEADLKRKDRTIRIKVVASEITKRVDELKSMGGMKAALVKQYAQPVVYVLDAVAHVSIQEGDAEPVVTSEKARYEVNHLNK